MKQLISIIVPVYNSELYLDTCLKSLITQSYDQLEIILVNDGSTDNSKEICEKWQQNDSRIRIINQNNQGSSSARNAGINCAKGEWILFVDSDDMLANNAINDLFEYSAGVDVVSFGWSVIDSYGKILDNVVPDDVSHGDEENLLNQIVSGPLQNYFWSYLFSKKLIDSFVLKYGTLFDERYALFEDAISLQRLIRSCHFKVRYLPKTIYFYRQNFFSLSHKRNSQTAFNGIRAIRELQSMTVSKSIKSLWNANLIEMYLYCEELIPYKFSVKNFKLHLCIVFNICSLLICSAYHSVSIKLCIKMLLTVLGLYSPLLFFFRKIQLISQNK